MAQQRDDPYAAFNFRVEIDGIAEAGFAEVSGLGMATDVIEYRSGDDPTGAARKLPGRTHFADVTLKRGVVGSLTFYQWWRDGANGAGDAARSVAIVLFNEDRSAEVMRFRLSNARIVKLTFGPLNARGTDVAMEELVLAYERLDIE